MQNVVRARFIRDKTQERSVVYSDLGVKRVHDIKFRNYSHNQIKYLEYVVERADHRVYTFNDNDLVNLNPYDLITLWAYTNNKSDTAIKYNAALREIKMVMEEHVKLRAKTDFQIALELGVD